MLKDIIQKHALNCGLSKRLQNKTAIIIELLEECSSGLKFSKHSQLIDIMNLKICNPNDLKIQQNIIKERAIDIDSEYDLKLAEYLISKKEVPSIMENTIVYSFPLVTSIIIISLPLVW